jgi:hypothetical protein
MYVLSISETKGAVMSAVPCSEVNNNKIEEISGKWSDHCAQGHCNNSLQLLKSFNVPL